MVNRRSPAMAGQVLHLINFSGGGKVIALKSATLILEDTIASKKSNELLQRKKMSDAHKKRAVIEPIIGHIQSDHRLNRNFYKGIAGDNINIMLAAVAFNFKRMMNKWKSSFWTFFERYFFVTNFY